MQRPFLKWAGNKYTIITRIKRLLPDGKRLIEPFIGSAAFFLNTDYPSALLADTNANLISLYKILQNEGKYFIDYCHTFFQQKYNDEATYYELRTEFNTTDSMCRKAALFLYLNRHGYNGLCRYNAKGGFNVPFGRYKKPYFPADEMRAFHHKAQNATFVVADFRDVMHLARPGDVVYCDPPYVPLSCTANFTSYGAKGFAEKEQLALTQLAEALSREGVSVVISNHDTASTLYAYRNAVLSRFTVRRSISCIGKNRTNAKEILALFKAA